MAGETFLSALWDPLAGLKCRPACMVTADLTGDGEHSLVIGETDGRIRVFRGVVCVYETVLKGEGTAPPLTPAALTCLTPVVGNEPLVVVLQGNTLTMLAMRRSQLDIVGKMVIPSMPVSPREADTFDKVLSGSLSVADCATELILMRDDHIPLSPFAQRFLALPPPPHGSVAPRPAEPGQQADPHPPNRARLLDYLSEGDLSESCVAGTCLATIRSSDNEGDDIRRLLVGTESGQVLLLDPTLGSVSASYSLTGVPVSMAVEGTFGAGWRATVLCRDGIIHSIRDGTVSRNTINLETAAVGAVRIASSIAVATLTGDLILFTPRGRREALYRLGATPTCLCPVHVTSGKGFNGLAVGLSNGTVRFYTSSGPTYLHTLPSNPLSVLFTPYGREERCLITHTEGGGLSILILHRHANLGKRERSDTRPVEHNHPILIPAAEVGSGETLADHVRFLSARASLRNEVLKQRIGLAKTALGSSTPGGGKDRDGAFKLHVSAVLKGLGPRFKLVVTVRNIGTELAAGVPVLFVSEVHEPSDPHILLPSIPAGKEHTFSVWLDPPHSGYLPSHVMRVVLCRVSGS
ncbi:Bardet-Biedl syndrome 1 protein, partial [Kipferlia bialata]|eukprot:g7342.t1